MTKKASYLEHAAVTVADIDWSLKFFQEVLGMTETRRKEKEGKLQQVWLKGGQKIYHDLNDQPETTFSDGMLWLKTEKVSVSYPLTDVLRYTFEGAMTAIETPLVRPGEMRFSQNNEAMAFDGLPDGTVLEVYSLDGKKISSVKAQGGQQTIISLAKHPAGTYIVKMGDAAFKFLKR